MRKPIGISILTNGNRTQELLSCVQDLLENCFYRPFVIGIYDNGSTDCVDLSHTLFTEVYGVTFRFGRSETDEGCAEGTNKASELVRDCEYVMHIESDFTHLPGHMSGEDKLWLHRAIDFMEEGTCDYLYLRRMVNEESIRLHWWDRWAETLAATDRGGSYIPCPGFKWSNNPHLRRNNAIYEDGCLPLKGQDGPKGTPHWSQPELQAPEPPRAWVHRWGIFVHDVDLFELSAGCGKYGEGYLSCKYGFFKDGRDGFCQACQGPDISDMRAHYRRFVGEK